MRVKWGLYKSSVWFKANKIIIWTVSQWDCFAIWLCCAKYWLRRPRAFWKCSCFIEFSSIFLYMLIPTEQHNVVTALQNVASLHAVQLCYSVGSSLCNVVNGTRKAVNCNVVQRCGGSCTTLPNVIQRCAMLSHRCQTLSNVVQRCNKAVRCCIKAVQRFKLYNAAIVQRCATLPNVIQRNATL